MMRIIFFLTVLSLVSAAFCKVQTLADANDVAKIVTTNGSSTLENNLIEHLTYSVLKKDSENSTNETQPKNSIRYVLGNRITNDRVVSHNGDSKYWPSPKDVTLRLNYPAAGTGAVITYLEIVVDQTSDKGRAYVTSGGIGQRSIGVIVEALSTVQFTYVATIYGIP